MKVLSIVLVVLSSLFLGACATQTGTVRTRAARDLRCPVENVQVEEGEGGLWTTRGCQQSANYVCATDRSGFSPQVTCTRER